MPRDSDSNFNITDVIIAILVIADLFLLTWSDFSNTSIVMARGIIYFDLMLCFVLFCDFIYRFTESKDKKAFMKNYKNWLDIIAMIPVELLPLGSNFFLLRTLRLLRVFILLGKFSKQIKGFIDETHLDWSFGILLMTIT
ncbi:MAG: ion transporter, partial [Methanobacterium paludis]|nr:ion transporter [Methanobacterium paludis]